MENFLAQRAVSEQNTSLQAKPTEMVDHLKLLNPNYEYFEDELIRDLTIPYPVNPQLIIPVLIAGETGSGKTTLAQHIAETLKKDERIRKWQRDSRKKIRFYHAAIGRTQNIMMRAGKITAPRGRIPQSQYAENSEEMAQMSLLALHHLDGPAVFFDDSIWDTATFTSKGHIIGEQRGSLRFARMAMTRLNGRLVILETDEAVKQEEVERRARLRAVDADQAPDILKEYGIQDDSAKAEQIKLSAEQSGTAASIAHTRKTLTRIIHRMLQTNDIYKPDLAAYSLKELRDFMANHPDQWINLLEKHYHPLWANRLCANGESPFYVANGVYIFRNLSYPETTMRHRYSGTLIKVEDALAEKAAKSSVQQFKLAVQNLGITLP